MRRKFYRQSEINRIRAKLLRMGFPRLKMLLIVVLTGGAGFLASYSMLRWCITSMAVRYPLSIAIAYIVFLFLLWLWLRTSAEDYIDIADFSGIPAPNGSVPSDCAEPSLAGSEEGGLVSEAAEIVGGADEFAIPLAIFLVVGALLLSSLWIVYTAPTLFAELLIDGILSASLYRRLRGLETQHWLKTAVSRTILPFAITVVVSGVCGMVLKSYVPSAHSIGDVMRNHDRVDK